MNFPEVKFGFLFLLLGTVLILRCYYDQIAGTYYVGQPTLSFTDAVFGKVKYSKGVKGISAKYHLQLSIDKAQFVISDNATQIIRQNDKRRRLLESLTDGDSVTIKYAADQDKRLNISSEIVRVLELNSKGEYILRLNELTEVDRRDIRNWNIAGVFFLICGGTIIYKNKTKKSTDAANIGF